MLQLVLENFGSVEILINNAGIAVGDEFLNMTDDQWKRSLDVNLTSPFLCGQVVARYMAKHGGGAIVNVTSQMAHAAFPESSAYNAAKAGAEMLTRAMAVDLARYNIRVNALAPGYTDTAMTRDLPVKEKKSIMARTLLGRPADPMEMVGAAIFLASDLSSFVTGTTLVVDGGYLAW